MEVEGLRREGFFARLICQGDLDDDASYKEKEKKKKKFNPTRHSCGIDQLHASGVEE